MSLATLILACSLVQPSAPLVPLSDPTAPQASGAGAELVLTHLSGEVERRSLAGLKLADLAQAGAALLHFEGLNREGRSLPEGGDRVRIRISGEQSLRGLIFASEAEALDLEIWPGARTKVSIDEILQLSFEERLPSDGKVHIEPAEAGDRIYILRGRGVDRIDGLLLEFRTGGILFEGRLGEKLYPWSEVVTLFVEAFESSAPEGEAAGGSSADAPASPIVVDLSGGSRLRGQFLRLDQRGLQMRRQGSLPLVLPPEAIQSIAIDDGSFRFLSELEPADGGPVSPYGDELGMVWPHRVDLAVDGGALRVTGRLWSRGLGVHAPSRLSWQLGGEWKEFRTLAGIDDSVLSLGASGSVVFRVLVDGEERFRSAVVHGGTAPVRVPAVDLSGAQELTLEVQDAGDLWIADRANWLLPILLPK